MRPQYSVHTSLEPPWRAESGGPIKINYQKNSIWGFSVRRAGDCVGTSYGYTFTLGRAVAKPFLILSLLLKNNIGIAVKAV